MRLENVENVMERAKPLDEFQQSKKPSKKGKGYRIFKLFKRPTQTENGREGTCFQRRFLFFPRDAAAEKLLSCEGSNYSFVESACISPGSF